MNKFTKRILLCNDVILGIRLGDISPISGNFIQNNVREAFRMAHHVGTKPPVPSESKESCRIMQEQAQTMQQCEVCANGALFMAYLRRFDGINLYQLGGITHNTFRNSKAANEFGKYLVDEIECLYEGRNYLWQVRFTVKEVKQLLNFRTSVLGRKCRITGPEWDGENADMLSTEDKKKLLSAIMQRIIDNDGRKLIL